MNLKNDLRWFKESLNNVELVEKFKKIKLVITDVDGCLTNGTVAYSEDENQFKFFSVIDGFYFEP